jgi:hypothetical protein
MKTFHCMAACAGGQRGAGALAWATATPMRRHASRPTLKEQKDWGIAGEARRPGAPSP